MATRNKLSLPNEEKITLFPAIVGKNVLYIT